ncbi:ABC transporter ATP-binding protein [Spiroplasma turonicum]|uniref:ABC transporter ATP-binding protein n=1 Tax=Spiroplasma turonicum TaxID=216946 RepID=A0A0K1P516_9MOLU|nr:ABC transporter ATP-binding protein/permease [Spiroplasma turonicum]AKU79373.1 ABC transporter ATP-binding protein [Spiroplasma turonicum]ALX70395.1 ABC transporter ATP-binding protein/permease [Spiroplasma turonicum]
MEKNQFKTKDNLAMHLYSALKRRWILSSFLFILTILMAITLVANIEAIKYITSLLVAKSVVDSTDDPDKLLDILRRQMSEEEWSFIGPYIKNWIANNLDKTKLINDMIHTFFYDYVEFDGQEVVANIFNLKLSLFDLAFFMIGDILVVVAISYMAFVISSHISESYETYLKRELMGRLIDQDIHFFNENKVGQIAGVLVKDVHVISKNIKEGPFIYSLSVSSIVLCAIEMFIINWKLALSVFGLLVICGVLVVIFALSTNIFTKRIEKYSKDIDNKTSEKIYSIRLIKSSGSFDLEKKQYVEDTKKVDKKNKKKSYLSEIPSTIILGGIGSFAMASVIFGVFLFYSNSQTLISIISAFTTGVVVMTLPLLQLRQVIYDVPACKISADNVSFILNKEILINKHEKLLFQEEFKNAEFKNVVFSYPDSEKIIFNNVNLKFEKGKRYAFVGPTGSGKSTVAKLLLRFYDPKAGEIKVNGKHDLKNLNLKSWLNKIGYVDQEPQILSGTIYDNVRYGLENVSEESIVEACKKAKLHNLIESWEDGYDTVLFERGSQLSGGQKQRLVIARLLLKNPEILILDEATSALDNIVESEIQKELEKLMINRTTVSIAHRLSTIKNFDVIYVIQPDVGIVQTGTYDELLKVDGLFKSLYNASLNSK